MTATQSNGKNILFIVLDTLRAKEVLENIKKFKFFSKLMKDGIVYKKAIAPSNWTLPSHASIFTGLYPLEHGVNRVYDSLRKSPFNLPVLLKKAGYRTLLITNNNFISSEYKFIYGFNKYINLSAEHNEVKIKTPEEFLNAIKDSKNISDCLNSFLEFLRHADHTMLGFNKDRNTKITTEILIDLIKSEKYLLNKHFIFVNYMENHEFYRPFSHYCLGTSISNFVSLIYYLKEVRPKYYTEYAFFNSINLSKKSINFLRKLYLDTIYYIDKTLLKLFKTMESEGSLDSTVLIVTSDHGNEHFEHSILGHSKHLYNTISHVPLFIYGLDDHQIIEDFVSVKDIYGIVLKSSIGKVPNFVKLPPPFSRNYQNFALSEMVVEPILDFAIKTKKIDDAKRMLYGGVSVHFDNYHYIKLTNGKTFLFDFEKDYLEKENLFNDRKDEIPKNISRFVDYRIEKIILKYLLKFKF